MTKIKSPNSSNPGPHPSGTTDSFVVVDNTTDLAIRPKTQHAEDVPGIEINSIESKNSFLVSINPPNRPVQDVKHVPCDIVLVIDVSGSMGELAPLPDVEDEKEREKSGLTVLDLVRHSCKTIISTLNEGDRLAVVTFSQEAKVITELQNMTEKVKDKTNTQIKNLMPEAATNLWAGITLGLREFEKNPPNGNVQGLYILTDGMPNFMCPQPGYVPKLKPLLEGLAATNGSNPTIHSFGFGYSIRSDLMLSIAETGNGNFAFIPDAGMIGTIFIHAVANLYTTFATNATLEISGSEFDVTKFEHDSGLSTEHLDKHRFVVKLGSIHYGQSRDILISCPDDQWHAHKTVQVRLNFGQYGTTSKYLTGTHQLLQPPSLSGSTLAYHYYRNQLCKSLSNLYPIQTLISEHQIASVSTVDKMRKSSFASLVQEIASLPQAQSDVDSRSLLIDLLGADLDLAHPENGQIHQALSTEPQTNQSGRPGVYKSYWQKWGCHYLSSLWCAHMRQVCNSFKDAGPLRYGVNSPLFQRCKAELDKAFDELPPPVGTYVDPMTRYAPNAGHRPSRTSNRIKYSMSSYNRSDNPCVLGDCQVRLSDGEMIKMSDLGIGMSVLSPVVGRPRTVVEIVKSYGSVEAEICRVKNTRLWITPWHPVHDLTSNQWKFPIELADEVRHLQQDEAVYSIVLSSSDSDNDNDHDGDVADAHAVEVEGIPCVTLGHGLTSSPSSSSSLETASPQDVRTHPFFGNHRSIIRCLGELSTDQHGRRLCGGLIKDSITGLACGVLGMSAEMDKDTTTSPSDQRQMSHPQIEDNRVRAHL